jgi:hypothetical protein
MLNASAAGSIASAADRVFRAEKSHPNTKKDLYDGYRRPLPDKSPLLRTPVPAAKESSELKHSASRSESRLRMRQSATNDE